MAYLDKDEIPYTSREYLYIRDVKAFDKTSEDAVDPRTTTTPMIALVTPVDREPEDAEFREAQWTTNPEQLDCRVLLNPRDDDKLARETYYRVWFDCNGTVERPRRPISDVKVV